MEQRRRSLQTLRYTILGHMPPSFAQDDVADGLLADTVGKGKIALVPGTGPDGTYVGFGQLDVTVTLPTRTTTLTVAIGRVVLGSTQKQVIRVHAARQVAFVQDLLVAGDWSAIQLPDNAMGSLRVPRFSGIIIVFGENTVTVFVDTGSPQPTTRVGFGHDLGPETILPRCRLAFQWHRLFPFSFGLELGLFTFGSGKVFPDVLDGFRGSSLSHYTVPFMRLRSGLPGSQPGARRRRSGTRHPLDRRSAARASSSRPYPRP